MPFVTQDVIDQKRINTFFFFFEESDAINTVRSCQSLKSIQDSLYNLGLLSFTCCSIRFLFQSCIYHKQKLLRNGASRNFE